MILLSPSGSGSLRVAVCVDGSAYIFIRNVDEVEHEITSISLIYGGNEYSYSSISSAGGGVVYSDNGTVVVLPHSSGYVYAKFNISLEPGERVTIKLVFDGSVERYLQTSVQSCTVRR